MREFKLSKAQKAKLNNSKHRKKLDEEDRISRERQDHVKWCKEKAIRTIDAGDIRGALISFGHNMRAKRATTSNPALLLIPRIVKDFCVSKDAREFIEGFN